MKSYVKMDLIPFQNGRIACVKGQICKIYGMMIGSVLRTKYDNQLETVTYRVPLKGEERRPMCELVGRADERFGLCVSSDAKVITPEELFNMMACTRYYMKYENESEVLRCILKDLKDCGVSGKMSKNNFFELNFYRDENGDSFINGYKIENDKLVLVLAEIQRFANGLVLLNPEREEDLLSEQADILQALLNEVYRNGLWTGQKDGKLYYFTGEYAFGENWSEYEKMTFDDFKKNYEEVVGVVSAENTFF